MQPREDKNYFSQIAQQDRLKVKICTLQWIPSVAPMTELEDALSRSDVEIVNKWIPSVGRMTQLMDALSSSEDRIGGCPQQVGCHLVLIWSILDPLT